MITRIKPLKYQITIKGKKGRYIINRSELTQLQIEICKGLKNHKDYKLKSLQNGRETIFNSWGQFCEPLFCISLDNGLIREYLKELKKVGL